MSHHLLAGLVALATADDRRGAARDFAATLGAEDVLVFIVDAEIGVLLPAPGFPQTLPSGKHWRSFLQGCSPGSVLRSHQTFPGSLPPRDVVAITAEDGTVLVLAGGDPDPASLDLVVVLLPLVSAAFRGEQAARAAHAQTVIAEQAARNAGTLAQALDRTRRELHCALMEAEQALHIRDEFLSVASHELKTPLTGLTLEVQMLQRLAQRVSEPTPFARQVQRLAGPMDRSLRRLATLTNDLLDVSRIVAGRLDIRLEPVDLTEVAREVMDRFADEAAGCGCRLILEAAGSVQGQWDHSRLDQVITNLVANALAYGKEKPVVVRVMDRPQCARIEVCDGGPGIAPEDQERIFHRFEQARRKDDGSGLGLGLHIARELVHAHGGHIVVESDPGSGATFIVELPHTA